LIVIVIHFVFQRRSVCSSSWSLVLFQVAKLASLHVVVEWAGAVLCKAPL